MSVNVELQRSLFDKLSADLSYAVYMVGAVPDNFDLKHVVIGLTTPIDWSTDGYTGFETTVTINSWDSDYESRGLGETMQMMDDIYDSLNRAQFSVTGYNNVAVDYEFGEPMIDPNGITGHGVQRFRIFLRKT